MNTADDLLRRSRAYLGIAAEMGLNGYHEYDSGLVEEVDAYLNALSSPAPDTQGSEGLVAAKAALATTYAEAIRRLDNGDRTRGQSRFLYEYDALTAAPAAEEGQ